jgi:hypothetical protein
MGVKFFPFVKPGKKNYHLEKCNRWIKACYRPAWQLSAEKIGQDHFICSKVSTDATVRAMVVAFG